MRQDVYQFIRAVRETANLMAQAHAHLIDLRNVYMAREYFEGGSGEISVQDLQDIIDAFPGDGTLTVDDLQDFSTLSVQFLNFMENKAVTQGPYGVTVHRLRSDV